MHKKNFSLSAVSLHSMLLVLGFVLVSGPAHAGFQWLSPAAPESDSSVMPAPLPSVSSASGQVSPFDSFPPAQIIEGTTVPSTVRPLPIPAPQPAAGVPAIVQGFADKIPLSVALHQILPEGMGYSVAQDVSLSSLVSWKGGAPWQQVMSDMLAPSNLIFKEQGGLVHIIHADGARVLPPSDSPFPTVMLTPVAPPMPAKRPTIDLGAPATLLPSETDLPVRAIPDRNMPNGMGGLLNKAAPVAVLPPVPTPTSPAPVHPLAPLQPMSLLAHPLPLAAAPAVTESSPYVLDRAVNSWDAVKGGTLQSVLSEWCKRANVELSWQAEYDYPLQASVSLSGSFEGAVRSLLAGFQEANPQPVGYLYNNQAAGQTVLVVQVRGNSYNE
ncbi:MAG: TcpQ domain-containing protein [Alphaproteobacteria bacterium]|nr:TcpQ domain-containing protein [Alphaproteobacteria bacterium]